MGGWGKRYGFDGEGRYAHSGMLRVAMTLRQELEENGLLGFFNSKYIYKMEANTKIDVHSDKPPFQDGKYELLVTGHSLGAGVAVLLAMALRPLYDTMSDQKQQDVSSVVRCIVYGVPGGLVDKKTAEG